MRIVILNQSAKSSQSQEREAKKQNARNLVK